MFSLPATFAMSLVEVWQSWQTHRFLKIWSGAPGGLLNSDEPICNGQFLTMVTWLKDLLHIMQNKWISLVLRMVFTHVVLGTKTHPQLG
jgi:hypothetical protein